MKVRAAEIEDAAAIAAVHVAAFPTAAEAGLVDELIADGDALVSLVAEMDGQVVGHVLFSRMQVEADGIVSNGAGLAPVAVLPEHQGLGIGSVLIREGLARLHVMGIGLCFVLGHADYYPRFGFSADLAARFASPYAGPHFMALALDSVLALPERGMADYAPAFSRLGS